MNKYVVLLLVLVSLIVSAVVYRNFFLPEHLKPVDTGIVKEITITIPKNSWTFEPETIDVDLGDTLKLTFVNEDDYDHGVGIDAYGVSQRIPARATLAVPAFVVTKAGDFQFYCSVSCSEGVAESGKYKGEKRGHFEQIGTICVHRTPGDRECLNNTNPVAGMELVVPEAECAQVAKPELSCTLPEVLSCTKNVSGGLLWGCALPPSQNTLTPVMPQ